MRVATYNIASGGFSSYDSTADRPERIGLLKEAVGNIDADIIGLTDTFRWVEAFTASQLQNTFNYPYVFHIDMDDTRVDGRIGVALLSRYPILTAKPVRLHNRNAIQATIRTNENRLVEVFVLYLDDLSEATRQQQAEALAKRLPVDGPVIVMGDFNAIWPQHVGWVKGQVEDFLRTHSDFKARSDYSAIQTTFDNFYQATVLAGLAKQGLVEPLEMRPTALTSLQPLGLPTIFPVDHILTKNCAASDYAVLSEHTLDLVSDHYPLVTSLGIR